jgi:hypothetical protein
MKRKIDFTLVSLNIIVIAGVLFMLSILVLAIIK